MCSFSRYVFCSWGGRVDDEGQKDIIFICYKKVHREEQFCMQKNYVLDYMIELINLILVSILYVIFWIGLYLVFFGLFGLENWNSLRK